MAAKTGVLKRLSMMLLFVLRIYGPVNQMGSCLKVSEICLAVSIVGRPSKLKTHGNVILGKGNFILIKLLSFQFPELT